MNEKQINCTVKLPVTLTLENNKSSFHSGCKIIDINFPNVVNPDVESINFKNHYVAFLTVKAKIKNLEQTSQGGFLDHVWKIAVKHFKLMPDPHAETGAQDTFCFSKKHFQCDMSNLISLRIILQQPSPQWKDFKLDELKLFRSFNGMHPFSLPVCILEDVTGKIGKRELEGVPDLGVLSSGLQQMWALSEEMDANQTQQSLGRYDVDGCYDINLLSYS